jgi:hypothetical protein
MNYLGMLGTAVERKIADMLPQSFGIVVDDWTCAAEHYFAAFAVWSDDSQEGVVSVKRVLLCCGVQF